MGLPPSSLRDYGGQVWAGFKAGLTFDFAEIYGMRVFGLKMGVKSQIKNTYSIISDAYNTVPSATFRVPRNWEVRYDCLNAD